MPSSVRSASFSGSYESGSSDNDFDDVNLPSGATAPISNGQTIYQRPAPFSDQKQTGMGKAKPKRPTHFVCFPLVTDQSVLQLVESLKHFREVTTAPTPARASVKNGIGHDREPPERDVADESAEMAQAVDSVVANGNGETTENLKVIPAAAHRPPGTLHLTIGTMDLSDKTEMQKALKVLKSIDYTSLLHNAQSAPRTNGSSNGQKEIALDAAQPETSNSSTSTLHAPVSSRVKTQTSISPKGTDAGIDPTANKGTTTNDTANGHSPLSSTATLNGHKHTNGHSDTNGHTTNRTNDGMGFDVRQKRWMGFKPTVNDPALIYGTPTSSGNLYGQSGYKQTVSSTDRYVDKTYSRAHKVKEMVQLKGLRPRVKSLKREVSPPRSVASTARERLLSVNSDASRADGESLFTTTSGGTERGGLGGGRVVVPADVTGKLAQPLSPSKAVGAVAAPGTSDPTRVGNGTNVTSNSNANALSPPKHLKLTLRGIGAFSSPQKARVFYAPPIDTDGKLLAFANAIRKVFEDAGLVTEERTLTLHATVANMTYAKSPRMGKNRKRGGNRTVDGTDVVEYFNGIRTGSRIGGGGGEGYVWARDVVVDRVRICKMGAERSGDEVLGLVYPAVEVEIEGEGREKAEVVFA